MKLTNYSDYALRSLIYLAVTPKDGGLANIDDIAQAYDISKSHLTKIIHQLVNWATLRACVAKVGAFA